MRRTDARPRVHDKVISDSMFHREQVPTGAELLNMMAERSDVKAEEVRKACSILGFEDVYFFGEDDAVLLMREGTVRRLAAMLRQLKPDIVLTHFPREGDPFSNPHAIAGQITMYAIGYAASVDPEDANPPHRVAQVFFFGTGAAATRRQLWDADGGYYNDVFIDITDVVEKKLAAMDCLVSQGYGGAYTRKRIETSDGAFGQAGGVSYGEGFISLNAETHDFLPVTDHALTPSTLLGPRNHGVIQPPNQGRIALRGRFDRESARPQAQGWRRGVRVGRSACSRQRAEAGARGCGGSARLWRHPSRAHGVTRADARELSLLLLLVFGGLSSEQAIGVLMPLAANAGGATYAWIGVLTGAVRLVLVLLLIPGTWLVASWGRRVAVVVGVGLQGTACLMYSIVPDVRWMLLPQIMLGVGLSLFWPAYLSYFAEVAANAAIPMQTRRSLVQGVALLVSPLIGTYLAGRFGYSAGFAVVGAMALAAALIGMRLSGPAGRPDGTLGTPAALIGTYRAAGTLFRRKGFVLVVGLSIVGSMLIYLVNGPFLTLHLKQLGFASLTIGMLISLRSLSDVALRTAFTRLAIRFRPLYLIAFRPRGVALVDLLVPALTAPAAVVALMVLLGVLGSQYDPATVTVLSNLLHSHERDVGIAAWVTVNSLAGWAAAPLLGSLGDAVGLTAVFVVPRVSAWSRSLRSSCGGAGQREARCPG